MKYSFLALILARSSSNDIPKKNIYNINMHNTIIYLIKAAKNSKYFLVSKS
tara:strand:- start:333 stop:485 length:153 start_codon:yes stop_codon:yes gene_type:complete